MWENPRPVYSNELYHYGVMGMHWGIRRYQPYAKGEKHKGRFIGHAIAKNRTTRDAKLSSFLSAEYGRRGDKLKEELRHRTAKLKMAQAKGASERKIARLDRKRRYKQAQYKDNKERANLWSKQADKDIGIAKKVSKQFAKDHPHTPYEAPMTSKEAAANRFVKENTYVTYNPNTGVAQVHEPNAPFWNWDRGWGHQWAVEKTAGFNYKQNRQNLKKQLKAEKARKKYLK